MAAKRNVLYHILIAMVAVNISFANSNVINFTDGVAGFKAKAEQNFQHQLEKANENENSQNGDRKFHWPSSVGITIHRAGEVDSEATADAEQQLGQNDSEHIHNHHHYHHHNNSANGNDTQNGDRKSHWPSPISIPIYRAGQVDTEAAADADQQLEQNDTEHNHQHHHHHHHHNNSANGNDTQNGDGKFHWPSSVGITIHRAGKMDSETAADAEQQLGQNDTEHIHNHHHHNNSANDNDTQNGDRKFHWPSSVSISIHRAGKVDSDDAADADQQLGQNDTEHIHHHHHHHHHHNNNANGNDTQNGDRKFHWPSSVGIIIHRAGEVDSEAAADADQQLGHNDTEHNHYHHNNSANRNGATN